MTWPVNKLLKGILISIILIAIILFATTLYLKISYPLSYRNTIKKYSEQFNVDPYLVAAIINVESNFDKDAISTKEARGLMQISSTTGQWASEVLSIDDFNLDMLFEPDRNIMIGTWYLNILSIEFDDNLKLILAAYNGGSGNVNKWLKDDRYCEDGKTLKRIPFKETDQYVEKVIANYNMYKKLYGGQFEKLDEDKEPYFLVLLHNIRKLIKALVIHK
ncbi:lytic transglycosylase domain-containing protein [Clostridium sp. Cult3]|uniref:lytic transglycosylase domain-containing protein n=1 Tax=Clostridium sp. Cult3 TaxID=2079004 RepID=UPI001F16F488|nr:lytic transglycosylase [Clostridium sp. Cult3]